MSLKTGIEWTNATWNPVVGCSRVSAGCKNCYAFRAHDMRHAAYQQGARLPEQYAHPFTTIQTVAARLSLPLLWKKPRRIFVNSTSDLFHEDVPDSFIDQVLDVARQCPQHTFQILTKRAARAADYFNRPGSLPIPVNVHIGASVENQPAANNRIPDLLRIPAAVRFLSCEPLLGPVDLNKIPAPGTSVYSPLHFSALHETHDDCFYSAPALINWVIAGGESGPGARAMHPDWARTLRDQCQAAGVPYFFKQWGEWAPIETPAVGQIPMGYFEARDKGRIHNWDGKDILSMNCSVKLGKVAAGRLLDGREWNEYPEATQ